MERTPVTGFRFPRRTVAALTFSFDDGLAEQFDVGLNLLEAYQKRGTFFIVPGAIGPGRQLRAFPSQLPGVEFMPKRKMASWDDIRKAHECGHEIGAHTFSHPLPGMVNHVVVVEEAREAKRVIKDKIGVAPESLTWPYYIRGPSIAAALAEAEYGTIRDRYRTLNLKQSSGPVRVRKWIDEAIEREAWYFFVIHGIGKGVDSVKPAVLERALEYATKRRRKIWVAPAREVAAHIAVCLKQSRKQK